MNPKIPSTQVDDPMVAVPIPKQVPAKEGMAELPNTVLGIGIRAVAENQWCFSIQPRAAR
jgi:hypothetical protein